MEENINPIKNEMNPGEINPDETRQILQQQTKILAQIAGDIRSMKRAQTVSKVINLVMFVIFFIAPIIVSAIFLPKLIQSFTSSLGGMYGANTQGIDPFKLLTDPNALKQFQNQAQQK